MPDRIESFEAQLRQWAEPNAAVAVSDVRQLLAAWPADEGMSAKTTLVLRRVARFALMRSDGAEADDSAVPAKLQWQAIEQGADESLVALLDAETKAKIDEREAEMMRVMQARVLLEHLETARPSRAVTAILIGTSVVVAVAVLAAFAFWAWR